MMTTAELSLMAFGACNALRIAAYLPQMVTLVRDPSAAASFSRATWFMFAAANASTAVYAGAVLSDTAVCAVHTISALCCGALLVLAAQTNHRVCRRQSRQATASARSA